MTIFAIYRPNVPARSRGLRLVTDTHEFKLLARNNPAMMTEELEVSSIDEARERFARRFEEHDQEMRRLLAGY